jgi:hypothetical protein
MSIKIESESEIILILIMYKITKVKYRILVKLV